MAPSKNENSGLGPGRTAAPSDPDAGDWRRAMQGQGTRGYGGQYAGLAAGQENHVRRDERIQQDVCERVGRNLSGIDVSVEAGVVTLEGTVTAGWAKRMAEDLAMASGVREVRNNLRVRGGGGA